MRGSGGSVSFAVLCGVAFCETRPSPLVCQWQAAVLDKPSVKVGGPEELLDLPEREGLDGETMWPRDSTWGFANSHGGCLSLWSTPRTISSCCP